MCYLRLILDYVQAGNVVKHSRTTTLPESQINSLKIYFLFCL